MSFENCQHFYSPCNKDFVVSQLEKEDEDFGHEGANTPDDDLNEPGCDIDKLVRVNLIVIKRHIFVSVNSAFQDLNERENKFCAKTNMVIPQYQT